MKIYLDFDRTLFDCDRFLEDFYLLIKKYSINKSVFKKYQNECKKEGFNPDNILKRVEKEYSFDNKLYQDIERLIGNSASYLYDDSLDFLKYLKEKKYQVIILTRGNSYYQKKKIEYANISSYYDELLITMNHKGELSIPYNEGIFIDDNPKEIENIITKMPKKIIRIKRNNSKYCNNIVKNKIPTVDSLEEIIINKLI